MEFTALLVGLAAIVWVLILIQIHDVVIGAAVFLVATSVFPQEFASIEIGLTITADRLWLAVLIAQITFDLWTGRATWKPHNGADFYLFLFLAWLILRTLMSPLGTEVKGQPSTVMHLVNGYLVPAFLYFIMRHADPKGSTLKVALGVILVFGLYLSVTAVFEITKQWSLVFPSFIGDPKIGIHFGRARGPMLQSVRLGMCISASLAVLWVFPVWLYPKRVSVWCLTLFLTPIYTVGLLLTYTRSIWMGAMAIVVILLAAMLKGKTRVATLGTLAIAGAVGGLVIGPHLVAFKREYSATETLESTKMRGAFAYVSMKMFQDKPLAGFGFNQFQVYNRPYLDDRTTDIRLESIRGYVHHNYYLGLLVELGLIGFILFLLATVAMLKNAWYVYSNPASSPPGRSAAVLSFCMIAVHAIQMAFHEISFSSIEYSLLMFSLGLTQIYSHQTRQNEREKALEGTRASTVASTISSPRKNQMSAVP
ncbi:MAG: O-antigen ligase family protein [Pirellula sp.]